MTNEEAKAAVRSVIVHGSCKDVRESNLATLEAYIEHEAASAAERKRCVNCRHWGTEQYDYYDADAKENVTTSHKICGAIKLCGEYDGKPPPLAFTRDASGYQAKLWSAPDFGCVLFEQKEPV